MQSTGYTASRTNTRASRGLDLYSGGHVTRLDRDHFRVLASDQGHTYTVNIADQGSCSCPDAARQQCKHQMAAMIYASKHAYEPVKVGTGKGRTSKPAGKNAWGMSNEALSAALAKMDASGGVA